MTADGNVADADCRELRRGPQGNKPHSGPVDFLVMPRDGQVNCLGQAVVCDRTLLTKLANRETRAVWTAYVLKETMAGWLAGS